MKSVKGLLSMVLALALFIGIIPAAHASPCCEFYINSVTQTDEGIAVEYYIYTAKASRQFDIMFNAGNTPLYSTSVSHPSGTYTYTIPVDGLLDGYTYRVVMSSYDQCGGYYCEDFYEYRDITVTGDIPHFKISELPDGKLAPVGSSKAGVTVTASSAGFYEFIVEASDTGSISVSEYPQSYSNSNYGYYQAGATKTFIVSTWSGDDLDATVKFEKVTVYEATAKTQDPQDGDVCFEITGDKNLSFFTVLKSGIYSFDMQKTAQTMQLMQETRLESGTFFLLNRDGYQMSDKYSGSAIEMFLEAGTYYIDTFAANEAYSVTATYKVPPAISYGTSYSVERGVNKYYTINVEKPTHITFNGSEGMYASFLGEKSEYGFSDYNKSNVVLAGSYFVSFDTYGISTDTAEFSFTAREVDTMVLNTPMTPQTAINGRYYIAFCAPAAGEYEFDMTACGGAETVEPGSSSYVSSYYIRDMAAGEWLLFQTNVQAEVSVSKYTVETVALTYDVTHSFDMKMGKKYSFSFTPAADGMYKIEGAFNATDLKIYTADEELYSSTGYFNNLGKSVELKKDVTVYISFTSGMDGQATIAVLDPHTKLGEETTRITVSTSDDTYAKFTAAASGYYNISMQKASSYPYTSVVVDIDGKTNYVSYYETTSQLVYLESGESVLVKVRKYDGSSSCAINITVSPVTVTEVAQNTTLSVTAGEYYSFAPSAEGAYILETSNIENDYGLNYINVSSSEGDYITCMAGDGSYVLVGKPGVKNIIRTTENMDICITPAETERIAPGDKLSTTSSFKVFELSVTDAELYSIENHLCNTEMFVMHDGEWLQAAGEKYAFYKLSAGKHYIVTVPVTDYPEITPPSASFSVVETEDVPALSVSVEGGDYLIMDRAIRAWVKVSAPYNTAELAGTNGVSVGVECKADNGSIIAQTGRTVYTSFSKNTYTKVEIYNNNLKPGDSYTITPYVIAPGSEEKQYGTPKRITFDVAANDKLVYTPMKTAVESGDEYSPYGMQYVYEFTQPEGADSKTYIEHSAFVENLSVYNEDFEWVNVLMDTENQLRYAELEAGKKYYVILNSRYHGKAEIKVSSLPDAPEEGEFLITDTSVSGNTVKFSVYGFSFFDTQLIAAAYDQAGKMLEVQSVDNPSGEASVTFADADAAKCKLFVTEKDSLIPVGDAVEISLK